MLVFVSIPFLEISRSASDEYNYFLWHQHLVALFPNRRREVNYISNLNQFLS